MADAPEYDVEKDPRTGPLDLNPPKTVHIVEGDAPPPYAAFAVTFHDRYCAIQERAEWNLQAFGMLYRLFQMSMQPVEAKVPGIAIAK